MHAEDGDLLAFVLSYQEKKKREQSRCQGDPWGWVGVTLIGYLRGSHVEGRVLIHVALGAVRGRCIEADLPLTTDAA